MTKLNAQRAALEQRAENTKDNLKLLGIGIFSHAAVVTGAVLGANAMKKKNR